MEEDFTAARKEISEGGFWVSFRPEVDANEPALEEEAEDWCFEEWEENR